MYGLSITDSMRIAIDETNRRRAIQEKHNQINNIVPKTIIKEIREVISNKIDDKEPTKIMKKPKELNTMVEQIEKEMKDAARKLDFERAMQLRDILFELKSEL